ncbi:MAG: EscU/YscU/HrcU family type III secretion system export apparatus switch protein [Tranquillimonas sp.]
MSGSDDEDKQHEPTQKKLEEARRKGDVARSADLTTAAGYLGILLIALTAGGATLTGLGGTLAALLARADTLAAAAFSGQAPVTGGIMLAVLSDLAPWLIVPALATLAAIVAQRAFVVAPSKLRPKADRLSPVKNAQNKFGRSGLFEFAKSFVKLLLYSTILFAFLWRNLPEIVSAVSLEPGQAAALMLRLAAGLLSLVVAVALILGGIDALWQRADHLRRNRMSRKEVMDEHKASEGDPHMKQERRQRGYQIATNRMLEDVPDASVVIVNPTHYAVALKWDPAVPRAPVVVAKGVDVVARRIRDLAAEAGVPVRRDIETARALHANVELGDEIRPEHFAAVAAAIRFADDMRHKAAAR